MTWLRELTRLDAALAIALSGLAIVGIGVVDYLTGIELRVFPLYLPAIALGVWRGPRWAAGAVTVGCGAAWLVSNWSAGLHYSSNAIWALNELSMLTSFGIVAGLVRVMRALYETEQQAARRDPLTGLSNRLAFSEAVELMLSIARRQGVAVTVAFVDLDHFKRVNDELGHAMGDEVLRDTAEVLRNTFRTSDLKARLGGDEFVIAMLDLDERSVRDVLERFRASFAAVIRARGLSVTASIGACVYLRLPETASVALQRSDALMYASKCSGRGTLSLELHQ
jgi:diguanylate cyclase (GGDEF)-like protein